IGIDIREHDRVVERVGEVEDVMRDAELGCDPARVLDVRDAAASAVALTAPELERHAGHIVTLLQQQRRRDRGSAAAAHHDEVTRHPAARSLAMNSGTTASAVSISAAVDA